MRLRSQRPRAPRPRATPAAATALCALAALLPLSAAAAAAAAATAAAEAALAARRPAAREGMMELLRIPSVSSARAHAPDVRRACDWLKARMEAAGLEKVEVMSTDVDGRGDQGEDVFLPAVYGEWMHAADPEAPTVLIYGHVDVQPADPEELWTSKPFEPELRDGRVYARGASDDKGHLLVPIAAVEAWLADGVGGLPVNVKFLIEGEEEIGSPHLLPFIKANAEKLAADYSFSADGGQVGVNQPGLCTGLRGSVALQVDVFAADADAHSGTFGGGVANPLHALADMIASMRRRSDGRLEIPGLYDGVDELSEEERRDFAAFAEHVPPERLLATIGADGEFGEEGYSFYERTWARPSVEVIGMWGGFSGDGIKTVLPAEAHAKLSARIVGRQEPAQVADAIRAHFVASADAIPGVRVEVNKLTFEARPYVMSKGGASNRAAARVLEDVYGGVKPLYFRMGGSIPVTAMLRDVLGLETVMFAFGHNDENVHAPDEFGRLDSFDRGELAYVRLFQVLAEEHRAATGGGVDERAAKACGDRRGGDDDAGTCKA